MMETALVFDRSGRTLYWHEPHGRNGGALPDSDDLYAVLWKHRSAEKGGTGQLAGVAHTHPWDGPTGASGTDLTTFRAVELGLAQRLVWPIVTFTHVVLYVRPREYDFAKIANTPAERAGELYVPARAPVGWALEGLEELRARSRN